MHRRRCLLHLPFFCVLERHSRLLAVNWQILTKVSYDSKYAINRFSPLKTKQTPRCPQHEPYTKAKILWKISLCCFRHMNIQDPVTSRQDQELELKAVFLPFLFSPFFTPLLLFNWKFIKFHKFELILHFVGMNIRSSDTSAC